MELALIYATKSCRKCKCELTKDNSHEKMLLRKAYLCKECDKLIRAERRKRNKVRYAEKLAEWKKNNPGMVKAARKRWKDKNPDKVKANIKRRMPRELNARIKKKDKLKLEVMTHYCKGSPKCKCGYNDIRALTIDHVDGDGAEHRREIGGGGIKLYVWLKNNNYPDGFQILCMNCQFIKRMENFEFLPKDRREIYRLRTAV